MTLYLELQNCWMFDFVIWNLFCYRVNRHRYPPFAKRISLDILINLWLELIKCSENFRVLSFKIWFPVRSAQSQHPNVYKHQQSHSTESESMFFVTNYIPYLWDLSYSFSNCLIDFKSCEVVSSTCMRKNESIIAVDMKL